MLTSLALAALLARTPSVTVEVPDKIDLCAEVWTPVVPIIVKHPEIEKGVITWSLAQLPSGLKASIVPGPKDTANVYFHGEPGKGEFPISLTVAVGEEKVTRKITLVRGQAKTLLVDDDMSYNNWDPPQPARLSKVDELYRRLLTEGDGRRSIPYETVAVTVKKNGPGVDVLNQYTNIVWYTGGAYGGNKDNTDVISDVDSANLISFLGKGKSVILFSPGYINNMQANRRNVPGLTQKLWGTADVEFLPNLLGLKGGKGLVHRFQPIDITGPAGLTFSLSKSGPVDIAVSPVNPLTAKPLFMVNLDPDKAGVRPVACATANVTHHGTVVFVGFSFEDSGDKTAEVFRVLLTPAIGWGDVPPAASGQ